MTARSGAKNQSIKFEASDSPIHYAARINTPDGPEASAAVALMAALIFFGRQKAKQQETMADPDPRYGAFKRIYAERNKKFRAEGRLSVKAGAKSGKLPPPSAKKQDAKKGGEDDYTGFREGLAEALELHDWSAIRAGLRRTTGVAELRYHQILYEFLQQAALAGDAEGTALLLQALMQRPRGPLQGHLPLEEAVKAGDAARVRELLHVARHLVPQEKVDQVPWYTADPRTPVHLAVAQGDAAALETLLECGFDFRQRYLEHHTDGFAPIHEAACRGNVAMVDRLLVAGESLEAQADCMMTPLHVAYEANQPGMVNHLLARGANAGARSYYGQTPQQMAGELKKGNASTH